MAKQAITKGSFGTLEFERKATAEEFHCIRCNENKKAKNRAIWTQPDGTKGLVCNGCHGELIAKG